MSDEQPDIKIDFDGAGVYPPEGHTGLWEVFWPNRQLKYRANYVDGKEDGEVTCWWENGLISQSGCSEMGVCKGIWRDYFESGIKFKETEYVNNRTYTVRWYSNGTVDCIVKTVDGVEVERYGAI